MNRNAKPDPLPKEEVSYSFESISMDVGQNHAKKKILVIINRFTNYTWVKKMGNESTGTSQDVLNAVKEQLGTRLLLVKKLHQDNSKQLKSKAVQTNMA